MCGYLRVFSATVSHQVGLPPRAIVHAAFEIWADAPDRLFGIVSNRHCAPFGVLNVRLVSPEDNNRVVLLELIGARILPKCATSAPRYGVLIGSEPCSPVSAQRTGLFVTTSVLALRAIFSMKSPTSNRRAVGSAL